MKNKGFSDFIYHVLDMISCALMWFWFSDSCEIACLHNCTIFTKTELMAVPFIEILWFYFSFYFFVLQYLITHFSDFQLACLGSFFLHESVFFLSGLPFVWIERAGWLSKYKIQVCSWQNLFFILYVVDSSFCSHCYELYLLLYLEVNLS